MATLTHPPNLSRRIANHQGMGRHVLGDHRAGSYKGVFTYNHTADYGGVCPDGGASLNPGRLKLVHPWYLRPGVINIGEDRRRTHENVILKGHSFIDGDIVLDP